MKLKLDCGGVIIELTTAPYRELRCDALDAVLSRTEALSRLFQAIDELDDEDDEDDEDNPKDGPDDNGGAMVDIDRLLTSAGIATG